MQDEVNHGRELLHFFTQLCVAKKIAYYPSVPWDMRNLEEVLEFYDIGMVKELMSTYVKGSSDPTVKYFCNNIQTLARTHRQDQEQEAEFKEMVRRTKNRMENNL